MATSPFGVRIRAGHLRFYASITRGESWRKSPPLCKRGSASRAEQSFIFHPPICVFEHRLERNRLVTKLADGAARIEARVAGDDVRGVGRHLRLAAGDRSDAGENARIELERHGGHRALRHLLPGKAPD